MMCIDPRYFRLTELPNRLSALLLGSSLLLSGPAVQAQIVPDATLGNKRSRLTPRALGGEQIEGGAIRGSNLFHSFSDFNVGDGARIYFANPTGIQNILTRVTGTTLRSCFARDGILSNRFPIVSVRD